MLAKKLIYVSALTLSMNAVAMATPDLYVTNKTDFISTSRINPGSITSLCSSVLGETGKTPAHTANHKIPGYLVYAKCLPYPSNCVADLYLTDSCEANGAKKIGTINFSAYTGFISRTMDTTDYDIVSAANSFNITLKPVPAKQ